ncbi:hypothetical protein Rs2_16646 [Raphanus sativus]|nr:hypothetical protein Rs2_16646 [Raphanus sativus]
MDGHADIPPSHSSGLSQYPTTYNPFGDGGNESFNRAATMPPPPSGSSLAPFPPCHQFPPTTDQPSQYWSPNFIPGSSPSQQQPLLSQQPPSSLFSLPPLSPSSLRYSQSATVANKEMTPPLHPCTQMLNSSSGSYLAHKRGSSDNFVSLLAAQNNQGIYPKPIEMPVGARSVRENSWSHEDVNVDVLNGNKRRAGNEIAPPNRIWRSVSADSCLYAPPNPQGVSVDVGNDIAYGGVFTAYQLSKIAACDDLKAMAKTDPKRVKRILSNREAAARSKERKALRQSELEIQVETLYKQIAKLTAELELEKRERMTADDECVRLKILLGGGEEHAQVRDHGTLIFN